VAFRIEHRITGVQELLAGLRHLQDTVRRRITKAALLRGAAIIRKAARAKAPKRFGFLKRAIGTKSKAYRSGVVVVFVGVRSRLAVHKGRRVNPGKYAHLVEFGTRAHAVGKRKHPGAAAKPSLGPAYRENRSQVRQAIAQKIREELTKEARKLTATQRTRVRR
jgi:HK97 gp10 family phage protein